MGKVTAWNFLQRRYYSSPKSGGPKNGPLRPRSPISGIRIQVATQNQRLHHPYYAHAEPSLALPIRVTLRRSRQTLEMDRMSHCHDLNSAPCLRHLSQLELARRWCISPRTLERWRWTGDGPQYIKLKGRVAYREADVEAFETDRLMESTQQPAKVEAAQS